MRTGASAAIVRWSRTCTPHDLRHVAITRLAKSISLLDLARAVGHKDLRMLQVYYNESEEAIADKLE